MELLPAQPTDRLFHYTVADVAVFNILAEGRIRLGLYESTNDPAETKQKFPNLASHEDDLAHLEQFPDAAQGIWDEADWWLRRRVKLACFTQDFDLPPDALVGDAFHGWNHPAMWAHYGGGFSGVCLMFNRSRLLEAFDSQLSPVGQLFAGPVSYPTQRFSGVPVEGWDVGQIVHFGLDAVVARYIETNAQDLFFVKHHDWAGEREFRLVASDSSLLPLYLDVRSCLTGVVLGERFPIARLDALFEVLADWADVDVSQVRSHNGRLLRMPATAPVRPAGAGIGPDGSVTERLNALRTAEEARAAARERGKEVSRGAVSRLRVGASQVQQEMSAAHSVEAQLHEHSMAIPGRKRRRAPGVPGENVEFEWGWIAVVSSAAKPGLVTIVGVALQLVEGDLLRLHCMAQEELAGSNGNQTTELWREEREVGLDVAVAAADSLIESVLARIRSGAVEAQRQSGNPST